MLAIQLIDVGNFMTKLLRSEIFDSFLFVEGEIRTNITYTFDGHINSSFYSNEELETEGLFDFTYLPFSKLRSTLFELIKGKRTPTFFKFVFALPPAKAKELFSSCDSSLPPEDMHDLIFRLTFQNNMLTCTTGVSYHSFSLDKTLEYEWDTFLCDFLKHYEIPYRELS